MMVRELGVITEGFKRLRGSWTDTGRKTQLKHTFQRKNETPKASHTNRLVLKQPSSNVVIVMMHFIRNFTDFFIFNSLEICKYLLLG